MDLKRLGMKRDRPPWHVYLLVHWPARGNFLTTVKLEMNNSSENLLPEIVSGVISASEIANDGRKRHREFFNW